jgi:NTE family protein
MFIAFIAFATEPAAGRKTVGLALSGGGAKGLAHIGVLQWMEEHKIPIDAVAGTSMGGLIGGAYAAGRDGATIREFVNKIAWDIVLNGGSSGYPDLNFRRKEDQRGYPAALEFGLRDGKPTLPAGMNPGHQVELVIERIGFEYSQMSSFNDLPTPFRCVATDLLSGDKVVFSEGSLSLALRATMSLPAIFAPVAYQDRLFADGGMVDNLPADVVKEDMKVDTVIAVDLGFDRIGKEKSLSLLGVANRSIDIMIRRNVIESLKFADVVVRPDVHAIGGLSFDHLDRVVQSGYDAAQAVAAQLLPYAVDDAAWRSYVAARKAKTRKPDLTPAFVELTGLLERDGATRTRSDLKAFEKKPLDREKLENALTRITGQGPYAAAGYAPVKNDDGLEGLAVALRTKTYGPPFIRPLFVLDSGQGGSSSFTIAARIAAFNTFTPNSEWRTDLSYGRVNAAATEYYQYLGKGGLFVAPRAFASKEDQLISSEGQRLAEYRVRRSGGGVDVGYNFGRYSELRVGIEAAQLRAEVQIGLPLLPRVQGGERMWVSRYRFNGLNSGTVPTSGLLADTELDWIFRSPTVYFLGQTAETPRAYGQGWSQIVYAKPLAPKWSMLVRTIGGGTFRGEAQPFSEFRLGGPLRLGSLEVGELRGSYVGYGSASVLRRLYSTQTSSFGKVYALLGYETGDAFDSKLNLHHNGTAGIMAETTLGVLTVGFSYGESGRHGVFFSIGRIFDTGGRNSFQLR